MTAETEAWLKQLEVRNTPMPIPAPVAPAGTIREAQKIPMARKVIARPQKVRVPKLHRFLVSLMILSGIAGYMIGYLMRGVL